MDLGRLKYVVQVVWDSGPHKEECINLIINQFTSKDKDNSVDKILNV